MFDGLPKSQKFRKFLPMALPHKRLWGRQRHLHYVLWPNSLMTFMCSRLFFAFCPWVIAVGCAPHDVTSLAIASQFEDSKRISVNLATAVSGSWEKVCVLGPYSTNKTARKALGFEWNAEIKTSITSNDGISVLIFVQENKVNSYVEHPRNRGDFSNLTAQCFPKAKAQFVQNNKPLAGWPGLFQKDAA